jgi:hypothetical protein
MSDAKVEEQPVAAPTEAPAAEPAVEAKAEETAPEAETAPAAATEEAPAAEAAEPVEAKPVDEGVLGYKGPGLLKYVYTPPLTVIISYCDNASALVSALYHVRDGQGRRARLIVIDRQ